MPAADGAADHLPGLELPDLVLPSSQGDVNVRDFDVVYVYPRAGRPGRPSPPGWDETPGARGCTPQSCAFRDLHGELRALGATVHGLSAQPLDEQREFAERERIPYPLLNDSGLRLAEDPGFPTFEAGGMRLYRRLTLIARPGLIEQVI